MLDLVVLPPQKWISVCVINGVYFIFNSWTLYRERRNRIKSLSSSSSYQSKQNRHCPISCSRLSIIPILCMISSICTNFLFIFLYFDISCKFATRCGFIVARFFNFIGFYQLSVLHYCSYQTNQAIDHDDDAKKKAYPKWLFYIMYIIGVILLIDSFVGMIYTVDIPKTCGIHINHNQDHDQLTYIAEYAYNRDLDHTQLWFAASVSVYFLWDFTTLCLLICMIKRLSFGNYEGQILSILNRILLLTMVYETTWIAFYVAGIFYFISPVKYEVIFFFAKGLSSVTTSYSVFLMQKHNDKEYYRFLRISYKIGVYHVVCCCFRSIVKRELEPHSGEKQLAAIVVNKNNKNKQIEPSQSGQPDQAHQEEEEKEGTNDTMRTSKESKTSKNTNTSSSGTRLGKSENFKSLKITMAAFSKNNEQIKMIYDVMMGLKLSNSEETDVVISRIISEYAVTAYRECIGCHTKYGFIECYKDYSIVNKALANIDEHGGIRFYYNCDPSDAAIMNAVDDSVDVLCTECAEDWICESCNTQYLGHNHKDMILEQGCDSCLCRMCKECAVWHQGEMKCIDCRADQSEVSMDTYHGHESVEISSKVSKPTNHPFSMATHRDHQSIISYEGKSTRL